VQGHGEWLENLDVFGAQSWWAGSVLVWGKMGICIRSTWTSWIFLVMLPSGYVKIAIENDHL